MKKMIAVLLTLVLVALSCASLAEDASLDYVKNNGKFVLGLDDSFPPMGYTDETGEIVGFDIDVAREVCVRLGVELVLQPISWDAKEMELNSKNIDCIWNGMTVTEQRQNDMSLSLSYLENEQVVVVKSDSGIATLADLAGKTVGVQAGSSGEEALDAVPELTATFAELVPFDDYAIALQDLQVGGVDAVVLDIIVANYYIVTMEADFSELDESLASEEYAIGFRKEDVALTDAVNQILIEMAEDGTLAAISDDWFGEDITIITEAAAQQ